MLFCVVKIDFFLISGSGFQLVPFITYFIFLHFALAKIMCVDFRICWGLSCTSSRLPVASLMLKVSKLRIADGEPE
ncbi:hypothetical protein L1887_16930 [Cichorium endivia]|nr:hypothetical protein L1887_16930 [Cichorium endivia]